MKKKYSPFEDFKSHVFLFTDEELENLRFTVMMERMSRRPIHNI